MWVDLWASTERNWRLPSGLSWYASELDAKSFLPCCSSGKGSSVEWLSYIAETPSLFTEISNQWDDAHPACRTDDESRETFSSTTIGIPEYVTLGYPASFKRAAPGV